MDCFQSRLNLLSYVYYSCSNIEGKYDCGNRQLIFIILPVSRLMEASWLAKINNNFENPIAVEVELPLILKHGKIFFSILLESCQSPMYSLRYQMIQ